MDARVFIARALIGLCVLGLFAWGAPALAQPARVFGTMGRTLARYPVDQAEVARLKPEYPHVVELLEKGEALAVSGDSTQALGMFNLAAEEYPHSALVARRQCEALTVLGRRAEAVEACRDAIQQAPIPLNTRAAVRASLAGTEPLSAADLAHALQLAAIERHRRPEEAWGYAALCDVGDRIGDEAMLRYCLGELLRIAPNDPTTRRVLDELNAPWWMAAAWVVIAFAILGTIVHAIWHVVGRTRRRVHTAAMIGFMVFAGALSTAPARAESTPASPAEDEHPPAPALHKNPGDIGDWKINEEFPDSEIPGEGARNRNPLQFGYWLQDVTARALKASNAGDHETAIKFFKALAKAVPDRAIAFGKLCTEYAAIGQRDNAIVACSEALLREGVLLGDYAQYVHVVLDKSGPLNDKEIAALTDVVKHVRDDPNGGDAAAVEIECDIGVKMRDASRLQQCTYAMSARAPNAAKTLTYEWSLAMVQGRYEEAERLIQLANEGSMRPDGLAQMERETARERSRHRMALVFGGASALLLIAALALATAAFRRRSAVSPPITQET
ncbi:MAG: hypothetical protein M3O46_06170 [Myxococcota bacterium]|nr:hypothetical protein [Myxococcota bacterium]